MRRKRLYEAWPRNGLTRAADPVLVLADDEIEVRRLLDGREGGIAEIVEVLVPATVAGPSRVIA